MKRKKIIVGTRVKVRDWGQLYTTYFNKFEEMGFKNPRKAKGNYFDVRWGKPNKFRGVAFKVFARSKHDGGCWGLYGIQDKKGNQFLIGTGGIRRIK